MGNIRIWTKVKDRGHLCTLRVEPSATVDSVKNMLQHYESVKNLYDGAFPASEQLLRISQCGEELIDETKLLSNPAIGNDKIIHLERKTDERIAVEKESADERERLANSPSRSTPSQ